MKINSPFLFIIYDTEHDIPLFVGKITNPSPNHPQILNRNIDKNNENQFDDVNEQRNESKTVCSGGTLEVCIEKVCNFLNTDLQKICFLDCDKKCKIQSVPKKI